MLFGASRVILGGLGAVVFVVGVLAAVEGAGPAAFWLLLVGGVLVLVSLFERTRYRSEAAERGSEPVGPGGGEVDPLPARFRQTEERFVDPTSGRVMRVYVDARTGERRYRAEG